MDDTAATRVRRYARWHAVIWKFGGGRERGLLALLCATAYLFLPATVLWLFISGSRLEFPFEFYAMVVIAVTNILFLVDVLGVAVYTTDSWAKLLALGQFTIHEGAASEYLKYLKAHGDGTRLPGAARLAWLGWALFFGLFVLSLAFGSSVLALVGPPTLILFFMVDAAAVLAFRRFSRKRQPILYGLPDSAGVRLSEPMFSRFP